jgi:hypothetical protein
MICWRPSDDGSYENVFDKTGYGLDKSCDFIWEFALTSDDYINLFKFSLSDCDYVDTQIWGFLLKFWDVICAVYITWELLGNQVIEKYRHKMEVV